MKPTRQTNKGEGKETILQEVQEESELANGVTDKAFILKEGSAVEITCRFPIGPGLGCSILRAVRNPIPFTGLCEHCTHVVHTKPYMKSLIEQK